MRITMGQALIMIAIIAAATFLTRVLPFLIFPPHKPTPAYVAYLGKVLPYAITGMLIVYCLKGITPLTWPNGLPEVISVGVVTALYLWKRNSLLAIAGGTVLYMALVQSVFQ